jgi:hypothetical protein
VGLGMLFLFAMFEKKRNEVMAVVERVRGWEG